MTLKNKSYFKSQMPISIKNNLVFTLLGDKIFSEELLKSYDHEGFVVQQFDELNSIKSACKVNIPAVIIIDSEFIDNDISCIEAVLLLKDEYESSIPIIFISSSNKVTERLEIVRAGAEHYFCKPTDMDEIIQAIKELDSNLDELPYRILVIDDDVSLLKCYEELLSNNGFVVKAESNPLNGFEMIDSFKPDVIAVDLYMPECSGIELVNMVRQNSRWDLISIVFLSGEKDISNQLEAMALGADEFLVKPINTKKLYATMNACAKRARKNEKLNHALKRSIIENKSHLITLNQHAIVSCSDINGRITSVNDKLCEISGYSRKELIGQNHRILKSEQHDKFFYKDLWGTIVSGNVWHGVICNYTKEGMEYWVESTIVPFLDEKGKPYKYVSVRTDVTALRVSEERLKRSQDFANIGTWDWNIITGELYWSDRIWNLFGYEKESTETTYDNFIDAIHPDDRQAVINAVTECSEKGSEYNIEHRVIWPDGSVHWVHESGDIVRNKNGEAQHMLGVVRDITKLKTSEKEMVSAREEAEKANLAKSEFLSSMSHELRTPMNAIIGFSQLLKMNKKDPLTEDQENSINEISIAGRHLMRLINEVLDLSKIESGHIDLSISKVKLGDVIAETLSLIMPLAQKRGIEIIIYKDNVKINIDELAEEQYFVLTDETRFKQVVLNLMSNAVKYNNENGKITVSYNKNDNNFFSFRVTDTGPGLSDDKKEKLFKAFERLGHEQTDIEGAGIGLVISKKIIELMGGSINYESDVGVGSTFFVKLPVNYDNENISCELETVKDLDVMEHDMVDTDIKKSVLYIEDNPANLRLVEQILDCLPLVHMWSAPEPLLGLELAMEHLPDLILLDINLPGLDGYEVLKQLRAEEKSKNIPVVAISANAMPKDIAKGKEAGFNGYITKPVNVKELLTMVKSKLDG